MAKSEVDEAFEWLIVILGILTAILMQYPEYFYGGSPGSSLKAAIAIIPPMVVTVVIWLVGKLSERDAVQAVAKIAAWMLILSVTWINLYSYLLGVIWARSGVMPSGLWVPAGILAFLVLSPAVTYSVLVPKYRRIYPGVGFLRRKWQLLIVYVVTHMLLFLNLTIYVTPD